MRTAHLMLAGILVAASAVPGLAATLAVTATATPDAGLYDYSYQFSITGAGANLDDIFLGSNDLSPLNVVLEVDGTATADWSWLGNDTPENYLQFFDFNGTALGNGDVLDVTFSSTLVPEATNFAIGLDGSTGVTTNTVTDVIAPTSSPTPEPGTWSLLLSGVVLVSVGWRYANRIQR
jgi:hypothetical protein